MTEVVVGIMLITVVLTAVTGFFVSTMGTVRVQGSRQGAVQLATDALEKVRTLEVATLVSGRDQQGVDTQWAAPVTGVDLSGTQKVYDATAGAGAGTSAAVPTTAKSVVLDGVTYRRYWYLGKCWQPKGTGDCVAATGYAQMYRVIVAVTWTDKGCSAGTCVYVASTLISGKYPDPVFNVNGG